MQTRTSLRNQRILWKALGGKPAPKPQGDEIASLKRILANPNMSRRDRAWFERGLKRAEARLVAEKALSPPFGSYADLRPGENTDWAELSGKAGGFAP